MRRILLVAFLLVAAMMMLVPAAAAQEIPDIDDPEIDEAVVDEEEPFGQPVPDFDVPRKTEPERFQRELLEAGGDLPPPPAPTTSSQAIIVSELPVSLMVAGFCILVFGGVQLTRWWWRRGFAP